MADLHGVAGRAQQVTFGPERAADPRMLATVGAWLLTIPGASPAWDQYLLSGVRLAEVPGLPPAVLHRPGMTHEVILYAIDPTDGPYTAQAPPDGGYPNLLPLNVVEQFRAADDDAARLLTDLARACVHGLLHVEPEGIRGARETWRAAIRETLTHYVAPESHGG